MIACTHPNCRASFSLETCTGDHAAAVRAALLANAGAPDAVDFAAPFEGYVARDNGWTQDRADAWKCPQHDAASVWRASLTDAGYAVPTDEWAGEVVRPSIAVAYPPSMYFANGVTRAMVVIGDGAWDHRDWTHMPHGARPTLTRVNGAWQVTGSPDAVIAVREIGRGV